MRRTLATNQNNPISAATKAAINIASSNGSISNSANPNISSAAIRKRPKSGLLKFKEKKSTNCSYVKNLDMAENKSTNAVTETIATEAAWGNSNDSTLASTGCAK